MSFYFTLRGIDVSTETYYSTAKYGEDIYDALEDAAKQGI